MDYEMRQAIKRIVLVAGVIAGVTCLSWMLYKKSAVSEKPYRLYEFTGDERDVRDVEKMFERDLYWLTARDEYDARAMMMRRTSDYEDPAKDGDLAVYLMRDNATDALIGFTAYLRLSFYKGKILFIAVNPEFRGKRYAGELVKFDFDQFRKMNMIKGMLTVRTENKAARTAYEREGLKPYAEHDGFMYYEKYVD
jgi:RimJ/RimL family protein N-acetyltransferase